MTSKPPKAYSYKRFSKLSQEKGGSLRRQTEDVKPEAIAKSLGLPLDSTLDLTDKGLSGFTGEHRVKGNLGKFLKLVKTGSIAPGSTLIIEELDRLTRETLLEAVHLMTGILLKEVGIYTGADQQHYTKDNYDVGQLVLSAYKLQAGHEESAKKSRRLKFTWKDKRKNARNGGKKLTSISPEWLKPVKNDKGKTIAFEIKKEPAEAIREIFKLKAEGMGNTSIAKHLNGRKDIWHPKKSKRNKTGQWRESYIQKIIHNRAVIGEYQPYKKVNGKRQPVDDPIPDYFPAVVDEQLFRAVHNRLARYHKKNGHPGGRTGKAKNLFSHIIKCGECGSSMHFIDKGDQQYLRCDVSRRLLTDEDGNRICEAKAIRYDDFEKIFFKYVDELDIQALLPNPDEHQAEIDQLRQTLEANRQHIRELEQQETNLTDSIANTDSQGVRKALEARLDKNFTEREQLVRGNEKLAGQLAEVQRQAEELRQTLDNLTEVRGLLDSSTSEEQRIEIRTKLRGEIRRLVTRLDVYPLTDEFKEWEQVEEEPGVYLRMESRYVDRIRVRFRGGDSHKAVIRLKRHAVDQQYK